MRFRAPTLVADSTTTPISHGKGTHRPSCGRKYLPARELPLFLAAVEAVEEAVHTVLTVAETTTGVGVRTVEALPLNLLRKMAAEHAALPERLPYCPSVQQVALFYG